MTITKFKVGEGIVAEEVCDYCGGEGVVNSDVDDGEGHLMHGVGDEEKCICQLEN